MSKVERGGGSPIDPPSRPRVIIFSSRLLGLNWQAILPRTYKQGGGGAR